MEPVFDKYGIAVYRGDCRTVLPLLSQDVQHVITDPPYGVSLDSHSAAGCMDGTTRRRKRKTAIRNDGDLTVAEFIFDWADERKLPLVAFGSPYRPYPGQWRNILVWNKGPAVGGGGDPKTCWKRTFELVYVRNNPPLNLSRDAAVLDFPVNTGDDFRFHPCQKPLPLLRYLIQQVTRPGDVILDPAAGSGSLAVAAIKEGRRAILIEEDEKHIATILDRIDPKGTLFS